jgi:Na+-translocating ferredoxin:NAD+ oxidoreductase RnfC subunit
MEEKKTRARRTAEQRLADLVKKQSEVVERQRAAIAKIEEAKKRLMQKPSVSKDQAEQRKRFTRAAYALAPEWDQRHFIAAIELALAEDPETLQNRGEKLLEEHGKGKRGRRPKSG